MFGNPWLKGSEIKRMLFYVLSEMFIDGEHGGFPPSHSSLFGSPKRSSHLPPDSVPGASSAIMQDRNHTRSGSLI